MSELNDVLHKEIHEECEKYLGNIGKAQITKIVKELLPELDKIISRHVKEHMVMLANKMVETFSEKKEEQV
jgi:hemerythrin